MNEDLANVTGLDDGGRMFMLGYLSHVLGYAGVASTRDWQRAFAAAADDQTVRAARSVLAEAVSS